MIGYTSVAADPFSILTVVVAPAVLPMRRQFWRWARTIASPASPIVLTS